MKRVILFGVVSYVGLFLAILLAIKWPWKAGEAFAAKARSSYLPREDTDEEKELKRRMKETLEMLENVK